MLGYPTHTLRLHNMNAGQTSRTSPEHGVGNSSTPQLSTHSPRRVLILACLLCFLWLPLATLLEKLLPFLSGALLLPSLSLPVIVPVILYPACFPRNSPLFRVFMAVVFGEALLGAALAFWVAIMVGLAKLTGGGLPLPM